MLYQTITMQTKVSFVTQVEMQQKTECGSV